MNQEIYEELLFARTLITDTKGESIFHVLKDNISSYRWSTCHGWSLSWIYKLFKIKCVRGVSNTLHHPSTTFSC
ncbi:unnamed protein product [Acanthoscelides obtectus]|uniref:Uncharacterized protein n=1 Tax=Acanthoscelides obtectus TaxID=200917 RepID=A0A9P0P2V8_ACAOB|nr:unnamed protein product [Acanthoscelides obtectus]CAK1663945.1 hypothetical protein AOBTE_LOCUS23949 [Acanthoscelides obtectus]